MPRLLLGAAALVAFIPAHAAAQGVNAAAENRQVEVEVREDGRVVATSRVRLQLGRPAAIAMNGPFAMRLRIESATGSGYMVHPHLTERAASGWTPLRASAFAVGQGQQGRSTVDRPGAVPLEIAVRIAD